VKRSKRGKRVTVLAHLTALRAADRELLAERDRRYTEVDAEREKAVTAAFISAEKALQIKETADRAALELAREIQDYKDEKANNLRSQIEGERGNYATQSDLKAVVEKFEATVKPLADWIATQQGRSGGIDDGWKFLSAAIVAAGVIVAIAFKLTGH
jgi:hypothetical protein